MESLKIGFIGSGFIAQFMAKAMKRARHVELTAIYNRSGAKELAGFAQKNNLGQPVVCNTIREVCEKSDAVAILSPNFTRVGVMEEIEDAVQAGVDLTGVICEKPLGRTIAEATRMVELASSAKLYTAYFENQLYAPSVSKALEQLKPQIEAMGNIVLARKYRRAFRSA